ncbi:MAG: hypothetical protein K2X98_03890 [Alphaproteobacteria bacterium]|nr:hypothetical protein [Alphaproteobacteria bacterium]
MVKNILFLLCLTYSINDSQAGNAVSYMQGIVDDTLSAVVGTPEKEVRPKFKGLIQKYVLLDKVLKQLLVKDSRIKAIQDAGMMDKTKDFVAWHLAGIYAAQISSGKDSKVTVSPNPSEVTDPVLNQTLSVVTTTIETGQYGKVKVDWYLIVNQGIIDVEVEGKFRMSLTLRSQYIAAWNEAGGDPKKFLELLQNKLGAKQ